MPIYEYRCKACGQTVEVIQKVDDRPLRKCTECSGAMEKLISRTSFHLKGGGWYMNSYDKSKSAEASDTPSDKKATTDTKDTKEPGTKPKGGCGSGCGCH